MPPFVDGVRQYKPRKRAAGVTAVGGEFRRGGQPAGLVGELGQASRQGPRELSQRGSYGATWGSQGPKEPIPNHRPPPEAGTGPGEVDGP